MIRSNEHYAGLPGAYLFATVAARVRAHRLLQGVRPGTGL